jgi:hypothetical protein
MADTQHMNSNSIYTFFFGNSKRIIVYLGGGGDRENTVESAKIGAKIDKITEKI